MGIYVIWMGIMSIVEATGAGRFFGKLLKPVTRFLFGPQSDQTYDYASLNISANLFGMGKAATPMGIRTIESMSKRKDGSASDAMIMMMVINATSLQLIPTTVISIRASFGSANPSGIILPSLIATTVTTLSGIILAKLCARVSNAIARRRECKAAKKTEPENILRLQKPEMIKKGALKRRPGHSK
jgi:spore maturation protein A